MLLNFSTWLACSLRRTTIVGYPSSTVLTPTTYRATFNCQGDITLLPDDVLPVGSGDESRLHRARGPQIYMLLGKHGKVIAHVSGPLLLCCIIPRHNYFWITEAGTMVGLQFATGNSLRTKYSFLCSDRPSSMTQLLCTVYATVV